jgi:hypothetical protein
MKPFNVTRLALVGAVLGLAGATLTFVACSSDDSSNPGPVTVFDSGVSNQGDSSVVTNPDTGTVITQMEASVLDSSLPDVGSCVPDAATCNSCYTPAQNPLNGCSPATVNCLPFDNTRVPVGAP